MRICNTRRKGKEKGVKKCKGEGGEKDSEGSRVEESTRTGWENVGQCRTYVGQYMGRVVHI